MNRSRQRISYVLNRYLQQTATDEEYEELMQWLAESADDEMLTGLLWEAWEKQEGEVHEGLGALKRQKILRDILTERRVPAIGLPHVYRGRKGWGGGLLRYAAIFLLFGLVLYVFKFESGEGDMAAEQPIAEKAGSNDILPGSRKATLTLSKGKAVVLTDQIQDRLDDLGQVKMARAGELVYSPDNHGGGGDGEQHVLSVPRGGEYRLVLPDGTRVWLNSASEIRYPPKFMGAERLVSIRGEVYFEVAKDSKRPFIVEVADTRIKVLGTAFNVSAYAGDPLMSTTLIEGTIQVEHGARNRVLIPGELACISPNGDLRVQKTNINSAIAWKNGLFHFEDASLEEIMTRVARWYDIHVTYENRPTRRLTGKFPRTVTLSRFLEILEFAGIRFELQGKHMTIKG